MAEHAYSTPTPIASRRRFGAGPLAVMAGSAITSVIAAGAAASVSDLVPVKVAPMRRCFRYVPICWPRSPT